MKSSTALSTFDRIGVAVVALLGTCLGWEITTATDIVLTPTLVLFLPVRSSDLRCRNSLAGTSPESLQAWRMAQFTDF
jgi:hypothetical protein